MGFTTVFFLSGAGFLFLALFLAWREHHWLSESHFAEGSVVALVSRPRSKGTSAPRIRFTAADGTAHEFQRSYQSSPVGFKVGERVLVAYSPTTYEGRISTFGQRFGWACLLAGLGAMFIFLALAFSLGSRFFPPVDAPVVSGSGRAESRWK